MSEIGNNIIKAIDTLLEERLKRMKYDRTFKSTVLRKLSNSIYEINYLGQTYRIPNALGTELGVGQSVWVKLPCGDFKEMHICGIIRK